MASVLVALPSGTSPFDPDEALTAARNVEMVTEWTDDVIGVVGWLDGGLEALEIAAAHRDLPRLAIVATPYPDGEPSVDLTRIGAKTLLLFGSADPATGSAHGRRWRAALPDARLEMVPKAGPDLLVPMWKRILSHLAPGRRA